MSITTERANEIASRLVQDAAPNWAAQNNANTQAADIRTLAAERDRLAEELELRRKVMVDIPLRCTSCGCDWDYTAAEAAKEVGDAQDHG